MEVTSPMAGTYYATPAPGEAPFVKVGDRVSKGQTICIIEAMKASQGCCGAYGGS